jgi:hypothetical protein
VSVVVGDTSEVGTSPKTAPRWDLLFEDYLVAATRFRWAGLRNRKRTPAPSDHTRTGPDGKPMLRPRWNRIKQTPDRVAHGDELRRVLMMLLQLGVNPGDLRFGPAGTDPDGARRARRIAASRLRDDRRAGRCLCASPLCGRALP